MIDYLVPEFFVSPSPGGSGGMHTKVDRVNRAASSIYQLHVGSDLSAMRSDFLLIEPLYFRMEDNFDLDALRLHPAKKILYCSEMEMFRWTGQFRKELLEICDVVTCNCDYQESLFRAVGIENPYRLIDPIPEEDFVPVEKRLKVVAMGRISEIKGGPFIAELFKLLSDLPIETAFVGGATLWGDAGETDLELEADILGYADNFFQDVPPSFVPKVLADTSFFVGAAIHDVFSSSHAETLMSECVSVCGEHPIYAERPGFSGYTTPLAMVDVIKEHTHNFKQVPSETLRKTGREWALKHCSFEVFQSQLTSALRLLYV